MTLLRWIAAVGLGTCSVALWWVVGRLWRSSQRGDIGTLFRQVLQTRRGIRG